MSNAAIFLHNDYTETGKTSGTDRETAASDSLKSPTQTIHPLQWIDLTPE